MFDNLIIVSTKQKAINKLLYNKMLFTRFSSAINRGKPIFNYAQKKSFAFTIYSRHFFIKIEKIGVSIC